MRRSGIGPGARSLERGSTFKPPRSATTPESERALMEAWGHGRQPCVMCGAAAWLSRGHHIITQNRLKTEARALSVPSASLLWDTRNRLWLCDEHADKPGCHASHHSRARPVPWSVLEQHSPHVFEFAREIGETPYLERMYPQIQTSEGE